MTHGSDGKLSAFDGEFDENELMKSFVNGQCPSLNEKPKLFFIQSCRGEGYDFGIKHAISLNHLKIVEDTDAKPFNNTPTIVIPSYADILVMHSTQRGFASFRNKENGSYFIQSLCSVLQNLKNSETKQDLMDMLTKVNREVSKYENHCQDSTICKQTSTIQSNLRKKFLFGSKASTPALKPPE